MLDGTYIKVFQVGFKGAETIDVTIDDAASDAIGAFNMHTASCTKIGCNTQTQIQLLMSISTLGSHK